MNAFKFTAGLLAASLALSASAQNLVGSSFVYQGQLNRDGRAVSQQCDFRFTLWDSESDGSRLGQELVSTSVLVKDGVFITRLDFGPNVFNGQPRWLEISVRDQGIVGEGRNRDGGFQTLYPRQPITPVPYALAMPGIRTEPNDVGANIIAGYAMNIVSADIVGATIAGGGAPEAENEVKANFGTIAGGSNNFVSGAHGTIAGGLSNTAAGEAAFIGGGHQNVVEGVNAGVTAGATNSAAGANAFVGGGTLNTASGALSVIGGGEDNDASKTHAVVAGGTGNVAGGLESAVGGGSTNFATGDFSTIGGGELNEASGIRSTVAGGWGNVANAPGATVGGGVYNEARGVASTVAGGYNCIAAGKYSFAAGSAAFAQGLHDGAIILADNSNPFHFKSQYKNEFAVRAAGGIRFVTATDAVGEPKAGVRLPTGSGAWENLSDRDSKANFRDITAAEVLDKVNGLKIQTWSYKTEEPTVRHIGPMAQDFRAAFGLGSDEKHISTIDLDGVALAAIQGLSQVTRDQQTQLAALNKQVGDLQAQNNGLSDQVAALGARLSKLEDGKAKIAGFGVLAAALPAIALALLLRRKDGGR